MTMDKESNWYDKIDMPVKGKDGLVVEKPDIYDKYFRKPKSIEKITPSHFAKIYESSSKAPKKYAADKGCHDNSSKNKWNYIMSYRKENIIFSSISNLILCIQVNPYI